MRSALAVLVVVVFTGALMACSARYGPRVPGFTPGYEEEQLGIDTYQVRIGEAWPKDWPILEKFAVYRASEITQSHGKRYFQVLQSSSHVNNYTLYSPGITTTTGTANIIGQTAYVNATSVTTGGGTSVISGGWYILDFKIISDGEAKQKPNVVDSQSTMSNLKYFIDRRRD